MIMILFGSFKSQKPLFGFTLKYIDKLIPTIASMPIKIAIYEIELELLLCFLLVGVGVVEALDELFDLGCELNKPNKLIPGVPPFIIIYIYIIFLYRS